MLDKKIVLTRSSRKLISEDTIGYGWSNVIFSDYPDIKVLFEQGFKGKEKSIGRKAKQIKLFYNLKKDDLVVLPFSGSIAIAVVQGNKSYEKGIKHAENRIAVDYLKDKNGKMFIPRACLSTALQARLRLRTTLADLGSFTEEIEGHVSAIKNGEILTWDEGMEKKAAKAEDSFKKSLLARLKKGNEISLSAGGHGLEELVKELYEIEGYEAKIQAKNKSSGVEDVDIIATRENDLSPIKEKLFIQVKHHRGSTKGHGVNQLSAYNLDLECFEYSNCCFKILITTAKFEEAALQKAIAKNIETIDGEKLVDLIYDKLDKLSVKTRLSLGISSIPLLI